MARKPAKSKTNASSALDVLLGNAKQSPASISSISEQFSSVMSLARADVARLMKQNPGMHITEARDIHARAQAMSAVIARRFREQRLTASVRQANRPPTGIKGLVDGPTYTDMFNPDWANHCPPDAIEATTSPVAYLADLYRYAKDLEATGDPEQVITLDARRPDLKDLVLDHTALNRVEPTLVLVNEILEKSIRAHLDGIGLEEKSVDDALLEARYPNALPFERYTSQINYVLGRKNYSLGDVIRAADPAYPYFKEPGVHSQLSDVALIQDTGFGPVQQGLLLEAPYFPAPDAEDGTLQNPSLIAGKWRIDPRTRLLTEADPAETATTFFLDNFGVGGPLELEDTQTFCLRTGLSTDELDALLSVGAYAPSRSANVTADSAQPVDGSFSGSVYINAGVSPAMAIETLPADEETGQGPSHRISHASPDRFDRMNRMIRLAKWLELPFDEVDALLVASMQAERQATVATRRVANDGANPWLITQDTLRSLGLFQIVRKRFKAVAEEFAALLYGLNVYGRGKTASQFDRVFNSQALFSVPLVLNNEPFTAMAQTEAERQKIDHLCAALGMTFETYRFVAKAVEQTLAGEPLRWSREVVSAFYRLVRLPRYLGLNTIEAMALLELLNNGGSQFVSKLAGVTRIASYNASANTDTLSVIHALVDCSRWLKDNNWQVAQLCRLVLPSLTQPVATDAEYGLLQQMHTRLSSALITNSSFAQAGAPDVSVTMTSGDDGVPLYVSEPIDWFEEFSSFIDAGTGQSAAKGLVKYLSGETEESFENALSSHVRTVLEAKGLPVEELHPKLTNMVMRARGAQEALLMEGLAGYLSTSADLSRALLFWTDGNRYQLLREVLRVYGASPAGKVSIGDEVLLVLDALGKRATLVNHLGLSAALIGVLVDNPAWFGLAHAHLSIQLAYIASQYAAIMRLSEQNEEALLDYFRLINSLWGGATEGDKRLIRDSAANKLAGFLRSGVRDVLAVAFHLNADGIVFTLDDLDTLAQVRAQARHTLLDARALLALHGLAPTSATEAFRAAAELALSCLAEGSSDGSQEELGQSLSSVITVTPDYLVANRTGDKVMYTITLCDFMDEPLQDVTVRWSTNLGELDQIETSTDEHGVSSTTMAGGKTMGVATVVATFGLGERLSAPAVVIDCDESTLHFSSPVFTPETVSANGHEAIEFSIVLVDDFGNAGSDREIAWYSTLGGFVRYRTYTDQNGVGGTTLLSKEIGDAQVIVKLNNDVDYHYPSVHFVSVPYFQYVRFDDKVVVNREVGVSARLAEINDDPVESGRIVWRGNVDGLMEFESTTDSQGVARTRFRSASPGEVVITASYEGDTQSKSTALTIIHPEVGIAKSQASDYYYIEDRSEPVVFSLWVAEGLTPVSRVPIDWFVDNVNVHTSMTDQNGKASYSARFSTGPHKVEGAIQWDRAVKAEFDVVGMPYLEFNVDIEPLYVEEYARFPEYLFPGNRTLVNVLVVDKIGSPVNGVVYSFHSVGDDPSLYAVQCVLDEPIVSTDKVHGFSMVKTTHSPPFGAFTLQIRMQGSSTAIWQQTFRSGSALKAHCSLRDGELWLRYICYEWMKAYKGIEVELNFPSAGYSYVVCLDTVSSGSVYLQGKVEVEDGHDVRLGDVFSTDDVWLDGIYILFLGGERQVSAYDIR